MEKEPTKTSHKSMKKGASAWITPEGYQPRNGADFSEGGGIVDDREGRAALYVRGPFWRRIKGDPNVSDDDVKPLHWADRKPSWPQTNVGSELELFLWSSVERDLVNQMDQGTKFRNDLIDYKNGNNGNNGNFYDLHDPFEPLDPEHLSFSDELMRGMVELNFQHCANPIERAKLMVRALQVTNKIARDNDIYLLPTGSLPHRTFLVEDTNKDTYVQRIARDHMGDDRVKYFVGACDQTHTEAHNTEAALQSIHGLQRTEPLMLAASSSAPFYGGKQEINDDDIPGTGSSGRRWQSLRYPERLAGSPNGGTIMVPPPDTMNDYYDHVHQLLVEEEVPSAARGFGNHADIRLRPDIEDLGTIEVGIKDNCGGDSVRLSAFEAIDAAKTFKLQALISLGRSEEIPESVFGKRLDEEQLREIKDDALQVSMFGSDAFITNPEGGLVHAMTQSAKMIEFLQEPLPEADYYGLPDGVIKVYRDSMSILGNDDYDKLGYDQKLNTFISGFYKTGKGTLSQWLHRRVDALREIDGINERDAITQSMDELAVAYREHLEDPELENRVVSIYENDPNSYDNIA